MNQSWVPGDDGKKTTTKKRTKKTKNEGRKNQKIKKKKNEFGAEKEKLSQEVKL